MAGDPPRTAAELAEQWDARYRGSPDLWTQEPNAELARFAAALPAGRALDVGAGDGRNAIWLATHGWAVTAIDVSAVALERAARRAGERGAQLECVMADWREHDFGERAFELVVVSFMHPEPGDRATLFGRAARALVPGGHLLTVGVVLADHGRRGPPDAARLYTPRRLRDALQGLEMLRCEEITYEQDHSSGRRTVTDVVAIARRRWPATALGLDRCTDLDARDCGALLHLAEHCTVAEIAVHEGDWMTDRTTAPAARDAGHTCLRCVRRRTRRARALPRSGRPCCICRSSGQAPCMPVRCLLMSALCCALLLCIAPATAPAQGEGEPILGLQRSTPLDEYAGWLLFSRWDGSAYRLSTWRDGRVRDLPVPPQPDVFDADAGPDSAGRPSAVVSLCRGSCDLHVIGFELADELRPVRNANTTDRDEIAPTIWKGRLAFGRRYGPHEVVPYTKLLAAPRSRPSRRLAGLPDRRCGAIDPPACRRIEHVALRSMELWGRWIAQSWTYQPDKFPGFRQNEIRLTNVTRTDTRQVAALTTGLGGQTYLGPSVAEGRIAIFRACHGDPSGCHPNSSGAIRYRISTGEYTHVGASEAWTGWAWSGAAHYHVPSAFACGGGDPGIATPPCAIVRRSGLQWTPISARRVR